VDGQQPAQLIQDRNGQPRAPDPGTAGFIAGQVGEGIVDRQAAEQPVFLPAVGKRATARVPRRAG
jgi:hypothetical protein